MTRPVTALVVDSMHVGDMGSVCLPAVPFKDGGAYVANAIQDALFEFWKDMCRTKYDYLFILGEVTDGPNRKEEGLGLWTTDVSLQAETGAGLLKMVKAKERFMVYGSAYHIKDNPNSEQYVAELLGLDEEHHGHEMTVELPIGKRTFNVHLQHAVPVSTAAWTYRTTAIAKELLMAELNKAELGDVTGVLRGHAHYYVEVKFGKQWGCICPCWKVRDSYLVNKGGLGGIPRLGYVTLEFRDEYAAPHMEPHTLNLRDKGLTMVPRVRARKVA
jgi:hypothetical protein